MMRPVLFMLLDGADFAVACDLIGTIEHDPDGGGSIVTLKDGEIVRVNESVRYATGAWQRAVDGLPPFKPELMYLGSSRGQSRPFRTFSEEMPRPTSFEPTVAYKPGDRVMHEGVEKVIGDSASAPTGTPLHFFEAIRSAEAYPPGGYLKPGSEPPPHVAEWIDAALAAGRQPTFPHKPAYVAPKREPVKVAAWMDFGKPINEMMKPLMPESPQAALEEVRWTFRRLGGKFDGSEK